VTSQVTQYVNPLSARKELSLDVGYDFNHMKLCIHVEEAGKKRVSHNNELLEFRMKVTNHHQCHFMKY
jgi:hypothetical protein